jgi:hypothetical protein
MASTADQASSTKLSEEAKQKLLELQTQLQEQQSNSENCDKCKVLGRPLLFFQCCVYKHVDIKHL